MRHYNVSGIGGRRVNPDDGAVEYCVQWEGYDRLCDTWEPRGNLVASCASLVAEVDARESGTALRRIATWAGSRVVPSKRARDASPAAESSSSPPLHAIVVHRSNSNNSGGGGEASVVALGERVLTDVASRGLNPTKKKKPQGQQEHEPACDPALLLEKCWREQHAVSFMHTCASAVRRTPAALQFELGDASDACHDAGSIEIHGIAPAALVKSGQAYGVVTSFEPLIGSEEAENLRARCNFNSVLAHTTQELVRGQRDQFVVRYFLAEGNGCSSSSGGGGGGGNEDWERNIKLYSMPLSVFRRFYPQLLLDYLLRHALVMESP
ncbi:hypothetical protein DQ04_14351010 [Trypanosoma grayi]|uniref:hypothetical protein n=1 Tax=Trypanosoma grayi TaxID=71804 RepID=UPI0004F41A9D|nr:hypothetical protein DQ04_14351010 [Trypanosoma grayi]KEG06372.1 hypothetical protein DQ04_14351010 [Trypanosoma grayi]